MPYIDTDDYRNAPNGFGPLAFIWDHQPAHLIYNLCTRIEELELVITNECNYQDRTLLCSSQHTRELRRLVDGE